MKDKINKWKSYKFKDVYLLGAGASVAYGFPTGADLKRKIIELEAHKDSHFYKIIKDTSGFPSNDLQHEFGQIDEELQSFFNSFKESNSSTIDSFVAKNENHAPLARLIVAFLLLESSMNSNNIVDDIGYDATLDECYPKHWISSYLNKRIGLEFRQYLKEPDCFITFNYDLLLESRFEKYLANQSIDSNLKVNANKIVNQDLPIFHVYGQLDDFYLKSMIRTFKDGGIPNLFDLYRTSQNIKFIDRGQQEWYEDLRQIIQKAERLIILGYGFDIENNKIIFGSSSHFSDQLKNVSIYSTSIGLSEGESKWLVDLKKRGAIVNNKKVQCAPLNLRMMDCKNLLLEEILIRKFFHDE